MQGRGRIKIVLNSFDWKQSRRVLPDVSRQRKIQQICMLLREHLSSRHARQHVAKEWKSGILFEYVMRLETCLFLAKTLTFLC